SVLLVRALWPRAPHGESARTPGPEGAHAAARDANRHRHAGGPRRTARSLPGSDARARQGKAGGRPAGGAGERSEDRGDARAATRSRGRKHLAPLPVMPPSFWVASTKPEAALTRSKAGQPC